MILRLLFPFLICCLSVVPAFAQGIRGSITNEQGEADFICQHF